jgi:nicotinamidase-related amidase
VANETGNPATIESADAAGRGPADAARHDWRIDEREYRRQEERRGRRFAYERLDPARTALVVVDMVRFFVDENPYCRGIVPVINTLARVVRGAGGVVTWVVPAVGEPSPSMTGFYGDKVAALFAASGGPGSPVERIAPGLDREEGDPVFAKEGPSAFFPGRCELPAELARLGIDTVLITGTVTNVCCESTARDAANTGLRVVMVADGCAATNDRTHNATLHTIYRSFGDVRPADEVVGLLGRGAVTV